jgi:hypothetical protein
MPVWETETESARRHVEHGEAEIKKQLSVIAELEARGQSSMMARELLSILERSLRGRQGYLDRLLKG